MTIDVEFFGSLQSPYCYFALDRLEALTRDLKIRLVMRPVLPGVIRTPDTFSGRPVIEQAYFVRDVIRTAQFLGLPYQDANPSPVTWIAGPYWVAAPDQTRVKRLYNILYHAHLQNAAYPFYARLMRLIHSGQTPDWDHETHLRKCLLECDLPVGWVQQPDELTAEADEYFALNQTAMFSYGHWGVPMCSVHGEPFYGQDRLDQLRWRIETM